MEACRISYPNGAYGYPFGAYVFDFVKCDHAYGAYGYPSGAYGYAFGAYVFWTYEEMTLF